MNMNVLHEGTGVLLLEKSLIMSSAKPCCNLCEKILHWISLEYKICISFFNFISFNFINIYAMARGQFVFFQCVHSSTQSLLGLWLWCVFHTYFWSVLEKFAVTVKGWGCRSVVEHRTATPLTQIWFPGAAWDFSPRVNFQRRLFFWCLYTPLCSRML